MALYSTSYGDPHHPCLIFLHGLLGSGEDWLRVAHLLSEHYYCVLVDLPGHGLSQGIEVDEQQGFSVCHRYLVETLAQQGIREYYLVGYSMGARLAMYHASQQPNGLLGVALEGGHFGLPEAEKPQRIENDRRWATRFSTEPLPIVLEDWYQQAVFSHLTPTQRASLIELREKGNGTAIAKMMMATSLGKQARLDTALIRSQVPTHYLVGENDHKFLQLAQSRPFAVSVIPRAGHNTHSEAPLAFCQALVAFISQL